jgi:flagellar biosynthesis protein FliP
MLIDNPCFAQVNPYPAQAPTRLDSVLDSPNPFEQQDFLNMHQQLRILGLLTLLGFIPFVLVLMTSFTRITIIFHFLRQALATQQVPSNQLVIGLSLILTGFVMHPVIEDIESKAITPYLNNEFKNYPEVRMGVRGEDAILLERCWTPLREFMMLHTREKDMMLFLSMGNIKLPKINPNDLLNQTSSHDGTGPAYDLRAIPWYVLVPAFVLSELRVAFMMGFLLFIPFLVVDMVVASILMSMGMMMLPPVMISMPFKLLLFIVIDGWTLLVQQVVKGFYPMVQM